MIFSKKKVRKKCKNKNKLNLRGVWERKWQWRTQKSSLGKGRGIKELRNKFD